MRIEIWSAAIVARYTLVPAARKDFFFKRYADAVAQAVLYSMFLAYPKSRVHFTAGENVTDSLRKC